MREDKRDIFYLDFFINSICFQTPRPQLDGLRLSELILPAIVAITSAVDTLVFRPDANCTGDEEARAICERHQDSLRCHLLQELFVSDFFYFFKKKK